ncbi:2766_t:CDS:2 [Funneliformis caledonium]|uniref:2766_t:CDS:1 n=1 Tax=Funneliformis caledonium TaxID=1117310 RepID=A0A9N9F115_9GLOM|nr:2766_t:CDS:2 [Funneliformis caledonium]
MSPPNRASTGQPRRDWRSGYKPIDELIQEIRLEFPYPSHNLNWIPYDEFVGSRLITQGGFSSIFEAMWNKSGQTVALKCLKDSQDLSSDYLNEIKTHWGLFSQPQFLRCYGITQYPITGEFMIVLQYASFGDLRLHLQRGSTISFNNVSNDRTHPDAIYCSRLLDFPELREERRRQILAHSHTLRSRTSQKTDNTSKQSFNTSIPRPSQRINNYSKTPQERYNNNSSQDSYNYSKSSQTSYYGHTKPSQNILENHNYSKSLQHSPIIPTQTTRPELFGKSELSINPKGPVSGLSVFIPDDDVETLTSFWSMEGPKPNDKNSANNFRL